MFFIISSVLPIPKEANQVAQSGWREEDSDLVLRERALFNLRDGQIGPDPRDCGHAADAKAHQHPGCSPPPEDSEYATSLAAIRTLFRNNRQGAPAKCNIGCCLSLA